MEIQLVIFQLAGEYFGVDIAAVESISKLQTITSVPHAPDFIEGVTNMRGSVMPVVDLRKRFGLPAADTSKESRIVTITMNEVKIGMVVDAVSEVLRISEKQIVPPPTLVANINAAHVAGIILVEERLVILLDLVKVLTIGEFETLAGLA